MSDSNQKQGKLGQERKDPAAERAGRQRPLEGLSHAGTSWTPEQDDRAAAEEYGNDEARAREASEDRAH
ncbi:MAG TPA: hypothetical protein VFE30_07610 [Anaeromyxobacteraceae bacterium]|jgi:hypothetical protein|nr:hypothetical protein [Anaeromyxobacteraceae bacterium]